MDESNPTSGQENQEKLRFLHLTIPVPAWLFSRKRDPSISLPSRRPILWYGQPWVGSAHLDACKNGGRLSGVATRIPTPAGMTGSGRGLAFHSPRAFHGERKVAKSQQPTTAGGSLSSLPLPVRLPKAPSQDKIVSLGSPYPESGLMQGATFPGFPLVSGTNGWPSGGPPHRGGPGRGCGSYRNDHRAPPHRHSNSRCWRWARPEPKPAQRSPVC